MEVFFSVGEPSGDLHGANLIRALRDRIPEVRCVGIGGPRMAAAGCVVHEDLTKFAIMWFLRAILSLHRYLALLWRTDRYFRSHRPDVVVLIDYPGFNWWVARRAKAHGIPVVYYGVPQVWGWAQWRVKKMRRLVDHALCKLPFEADWYRQRGCNATYVGHPYFDELQSQKMDTEFLEAITASPERLVTILPGSRMQEVTSNLRWFLKASQFIRQDVNNVRVAVAAFNVEQASIARKVADELDTPVAVHVGRTSELIQASDVCIACSGSVSLELLYHCKPAVILYWIGRIPYMVQNRYRRAKFISLVNLLATPDIRRQGRDQFDPDSADAERVPYPEYLTHEDKSRQMADHVVGWAKREPRSGGAY